ncbi:hypothetical protein [Methylophilus aquaticus]|uniref:DUF4760 domain-containing protein n=1 Tax=Methylophilus aquaticus TaxID=1971610 RepID=A0ABT9JWW1_9PROT|nr:hypothetical protein [Methylophilus aquaticus]MDP8568510.1 hypothetical protein [Methylophilus aquaticus]
MTLEELTHVSTIAGVFLSFLTAVGTLFVLWRTLQLNAQSLELNQRSIEFSLQAKQSDVLLHCNERFGRIWEMRANEHVKADPFTFYERFWSLQLDQFTHWKDGFVDAGVFDSWMKGRYRQWQDNHSLGAMAYRDGYEKAVASWETPKFKSFMHEVHLHGPETALSWWKQNGG